MKKLTLTLFVFILSLTISSTGQSISTQKEVFYGIDEFIIEQMEIFHVPGLSACIIIGDSIVWNNNYGFMDLENSIPVHDSTLFNVFSIGKSVTAALVMQLWDNLTLDLDQNINDILPFQIDNPYIDNDSISVRMLMSHSASITDNNIEDLILPGDPTITLGYYMENFLNPDGIYYYNGNFYNQQPGTGFHYCTHGPALSGYVVEVLSGMEFHLYAKQNLFMPLQMYDSDWFLDELNIDNLAVGYKYQGGIFVPRPHRGHPAYPGFFLRSTALELANFTIMLLNHGEFQGQSILSAAAVDSMTTIQDPSWGFSYGTTGLALFERDDLGNRIVWGHNGGSIGGYAAQFYFCWDENTGVVITTNSEQYVDPIVEYLFDYADSLMTNILARPCKKMNAMNVYPNPTNDLTSIEFEKLVTGMVTVSIHNVTGQEECIVFSGKRERGTHILKWDPKDFPRGIYFIKLQSDEGIAVRKVIKQ